MREKFPDFAYKEATLNPTNLRDRATDWEADVIERFRGPDSAGKLDELIGERDTAHGKALYLARPIRIKDDACLMCHSTPEMAPATMIAKYGSANGFGWQLGEVVGAQIVSVPTEVPLKKASIAFTSFMLSLGGVFAFLFLALNLMLHFMVTRPLARLAKLADEVSLGHLDAGEFEVSGSKTDEVGVLATSLGRMKKSVVHAMKMLDEEEDKQEPTP
jgi:protein-histidine pros-kinase